LTVLSLTQIENVPIDWWHRSFSALWLSMDPVKTHH